MDDSPSIIVFEVFTEQGIVDMHMEEQTAEDVMFVEPNIGK